MRVRETESGNKIGTLPREALYMSSDLDQRDQIKQAFACSEVVGNSIETYNIKTGLMTRWPIKKGDPTENKFEVEGKLYLKAKESVAIMSKIDQNCDDFDQLHYILDAQNKHERADATNRILALSERFVISQKKRLLMNKKKYAELYFPYVYKHLNTIDYASQDYCNAMSTFQIDRTFTLLDWKMAESIDKIKEISFRDFEHDEQMRLIHCIFTGGSSLLRMLAKSDNEQEIDGKLDSYDDCNQIF